MYKNEKVVELYNQGISKKAIRRELGLTGYKVNMALIEVPGAVAIPEVETCQQIVSDYQNGMKKAEIIKKYKLDCSTVEKVFFDYDVKKKRRRLRAIDEDFFEVIDSEEKAYWLGFFFADGYNNENLPGIEMALAIEDKEHLEGFRDALKSDHLITERISKLKGIDKEYVSARFSIACKKLSQDLAKHGAIQAKSLVLKFPTTVPEHLEHHFIRGYFDGDGSVFHDYNDRGCPQVKWMLLGTDVFLDAVIEKMDLPPKNHYYKKGNAYSLQYTAGHAKQIYDYLYEDATIYLSRKHQKFVNYFNAVRARNSA